jgi:gluconolactonase
MLHPSRSFNDRFFTGLFISVLSLARADAAELPDPSRVETVKLLEVPNYCEGVVFDHAGNGYISWKETITQFALDGKHKDWAKTGAPNGHKILADGTHLICDASQHAVLHLDADGKMLEPASRECDGKPLRGPNDLTLDTKNAGFYFTDPGDSGKDNLIGTVHYVDAKGKTHLVAGGLAYSNGIVLTTDGKRLLVAESQKNRVLEYPVLSPGKVGAMKVFADLPKNASGKWEDNQPDGMCLDAAGNLYVAHYGMKQVQVLGPEGKLLASYNGGNRTTSNVAFGGPNMDQLFITGGLDAEAGPGGLFRIDLKVKGLVILPAKAGAK